MFLSTKILYQNGLKSVPRTNYIATVNKAQAILEQRKIEQSGLSSKFRKKNLKQEEDTQVFYRFLQKLENRYNAEYKPASESAIQACNGIIKSLESKFEFGAPQYEIFEQKDSNTYQNKILPEIIFLGKCNSGKSTLLNNLLTNGKKKDLTKLARASKVAGYTKMLNVYNISNRFKIVDSPGYGVKGTAEQGDVTMNYLLKRKNLRRVYLLASAVTGLNHYDSAIIDYLIEHAIPFEIVWTKMDKVTPSLEPILLDNIDKSGVLEMPVKPRFFFINSKLNKQKCPKRYGLENLKVSIMQACNLL